MAFHFSLCLLLTRLISSCQSGCRGKLATVRDWNLVRRHILTVGRHLFNPLADVITLFYSSKDHMFVIKPACGLKSNEKLRTIGIFTWISHRQKSFNSMLYLKVFILKLFTVNALSSSTIEVSEVASLHHKAFYNTMKNCVLKWNKFPRTLGLSSLSCAELSKIFSSLRSHILKEFHSDSPSLFVIDTNIKVDSGVAWSWVWMRHWMTLQTLLYQLSF